VPAKADIQMSTARPSAGMPPSCSRPTGKAAPLQRGETLHADRGAGVRGPREWRRIADANGIDNPMDLVPG